MRNGKREFHQPCLTNQEVLKIVIQRTFERIKEDPDAQVYSIIQNDNSYYCECENCKKVDEEEDSHAGTLIRFVNAVGDAIKKEFPGKYIETLAYKYSRKPPKKTKLRDNVIVCLCPTEIDYARPLNKSPFKENILFMNDIIGWSSQTKFYLF